MKCFRYTVPGICLLIIAAAAASRCDSGVNAGIQASLSGSDTDVGDRKDNQMRATATFAAGCFWGVEAAFRSVRGVLSTSVGYTGGWLENPTYEAVCTDRTGHAEAVEVIYDPSMVSYEDLLDIFWQCHDPTQVNRQGPDVGTQYRSAIFFHTPEQERIAQASLKALERAGRYRKPIATEIVPAAMFWQAEEYHQQYLEKRGAVSCHRL